ncbi:Smr/MutS family protein [Methyloferula stellata]|uniref:Smr/MutS family protein n=1 Tax=Methyloferula stellata TaxID=876270 RepID=UPI00036FAEA6|nr:Smr/MutS family protein [Methyloferula stellata]
MKKGQSVHRSPRARSLTDEEIELWIEVARSVTPRHGKSLPHLPKEPAVVEIELSIEAGPAQTAERTQPAPSAKAPALPALAGVERRLKAKLSQGRAGVDAVLDLHGMHQHTAFGALRHFLNTAQRDGAKLVLVITGKGERASADPFEQGGVLRRSVPHWLSAPELRSIVIGFEEATRPHGGAGALYVRIRRRDRMAPAKAGRGWHGE